MIAILSLKIKIKIEILGVISLLLILIFFVSNKKKKEYEKILDHIDYKKMIIGRLADATMPVSFVISKTKKKKDKVYYLCKKPKRNWHLESFAKFIDGDVFYFYDNLTLAVDTKIKVLHTYKKHLLVESHEEKGFISGNAIVLLEKE